ncbi:hypothetical protein DFH09DRAFT_904067, partial [Mycena vulgaris]
LWESLPCTTNKFIPGKLSICMGIPVMLHSNNTTDMCITKGQESAVAMGWDECMGPIS